jgi:dTDP-4-amino-4,6-dideoxygalactose transaminase
MLRAHGAKKKYHNEMVGYNSRLDSIQAAVLRVKLPYIDAWNENRRRVANLYSELLEGIPGVITPEVSEGHVFHQYTIRLTQADRDEIQSRLKEAGIDTMVYYPVPQDRLPLYKGQYPPNPISDKLAKQVLSLPIWPELSEATAERVVRVIKQACVQETSSA